MKKISKTFMCLFFALISSFCVFQGLSMMGVNFASAKGGEEYSSSRYFYSQLDPVSKSFYDAFDKMDQDGIFKKSGQFDLTANGYLSEAQVKSYIQGNSTLAYCFQKARDAYMSDSNVFYVDFEKLTFRTGKQNNKYIALLGSGNHENYYVGNLSSESDCNTFILQVEQKVKSISDLANAEKDISKKLKVAHDQIIQTSTFMYEDEAGMDAPYVHNLYGTLINGKSVCEGYAKAFKIVCDNLKINNVYAIGLAKNSQAIIELHAWNYVMIDGKWYAVDTTWDDPVGGQMKDAYFLNGSRIFGANHYENGIISPNGHEFKYPTLNNEGYGIAENMSGLVVVTTEKVDDKGNNYTEMKVSYDGMGPRALAKLGLTFVQKTYLTSTGEWCDWFAYEEGTFGGGVFENDYFLVLPIYNQRYSQFAVTDLPLPLPSEEYFKISNENIIAISEIHENRFEGQYVPPPYIKDATPTIQQALTPEKTYDVECFYTDDLRAVNSEDISIRVECSVEGAAGKSIIKDFKWDIASKNKISFSFTPSSMYAHQSTIYSFYLVGLVGDKSGKTPMPLNYVVQRPMLTNYFCPFRGDTAFINTTAQPILIADQDLSKTSWVDQDGNTVTEDLLYNMVMITNRPDENKQEQIEDLIENDMGGKGTISETYDIKIALCSKEVQLKDNYVYLMLGFPKGLDSTSVGVEYTIYHFKENADGSLVQEKIPCVVTEYGLIAEVRSFSPFAVVVSEKSPVETVAKSVYVDNSFGGLASKEGIVNLASGEKFEVKITTKAGYEIESILLNNKNVEISNVQSMIVNAEYEALNENNQIKIKYVATKIKDEERAQGIENITPVLDVVKEISAPSLPIISKNLKSQQIVKLGEDLTLSVEAAITDKGLITYTWYKDGEIIKGQTGNTLTLTGITKNELGNYKVVVHNTLYNQSVELSSETCKVKVENSAMYMLIFTLVGIAAISMVIYFFVFRPRKKQK